MSRFSKDSKFRLRDFRDRGGSDYETCDVYEHQELGMHYIPIHPFSDEKDTLNRLGIQEKDCIVVDAYWNMGSDVSFVEVSLNSELDCEIQLQARWTKEKKGYLNLVAIVKAESISRPIFEKVMSSFQNAGVAPSETLRQRLSDQLEIVEEFS